MAAVHDFLGPDYSLVKWKVGIREQTSKSGCLGL